MMDRRSFLSASLGCAAHLSLMAHPFPIPARRRWSQRPLGVVVAKEPFGRLEAVGEGLWALVSTPLGGDYTTVCNGGIIAGTAGVLVVEAFQTPAGARWMAEKARELAGRWPTHVLVTHLHGDHTGGVEGFRTMEGTPPAFHATATTRRLILDRAPAERRDEVEAAWADVVLLPEDGSARLDLGGRTVECVPREGHTPSDVTVELPGEGVLWCGDLVWNGMFPNYMDAIPSRLGRAVRRIAASEQHTFVPGHGPLAGPQDLSRYLQVIEGVEETARTAVREGWTAEEAAQRHRIPAELGEWTLFNPSYIQRAIEAWLAELTRPGEDR